jgi:hypothetical protein
VLGDVREFSRCWVKSMTTVSIEKKLFDDLLDSKLAAISERINTILAKWHNDSIELFLKHAADGTIEEAEPDAISLTNLIDKRDQLYKIKASMA